ncbi:MAG TPA: fumarate hydratase [Thermoplasmata archaeon]|nr:fumarate hydratase [Thermoplasmata archaeon]
MGLEEIRLPLTEEETRSLTAGDIIWLTGRLVTARDKAHQKMIQLYENKKKPPVELSDGVILHCGPIAKKKKSGWEVVSAGPTTSYRMEAYTPDLIKHAGIKVIIGKGGMGKQTADACKRYGTVYCSFTGGASLVAAQAVKKVENVFWLEELGMPEALWVFEVKKFGPLVVTIDAKGNNLTEQIVEKAKLK